MASLAAPDDRSLRCSAWVIKGVIHMYQSGETMKNSFYKFDSKKKPQVNICKSTGNNAVESEGNKIMAHYINVNFNAVNPLILQGC